MKKIFLILVFLLIFLLSPSYAEAADCTIDIANRDTIKEGDKPIFIITNTSSDSQKFFIRYGPVGLGSLPVGFQICNNPSKGIDLILDPGETAKIEGKPLNPFEVNDPIKVVKTFKLQGFIHTNDQCGETTITGHLRCTGADFTLQPKAGRTDICRIDTDKDAVKPGESFNVVLTNKHTENIDVQIEIQPPGTFSKFFLSPKGPLKPGESQNWQTAVKQGGTDRPEQVYIRAKPLHLLETYCSKTIYVTIDPDSLPSYLEGFSPQECYVSGTEWTDERGWHPGSKGIQTALGCIPTEVAPLVSWLFKYAIAIAGGIAFLMIIFSSFQMITSSGDPEKLQKAKQMLGSAVAGLLFIAFAVFLLRIIGVEILGIF